MSRWHPKVTEAKVVAYLGGPGWGRRMSPEEVERNWDAAWEIVTEEAYAEPCEDCGKPMRLHTVEESHFNTLNGEPIRIVCCPEPFPADDTQGGSEL